MVEPEQTEPVELPADLVSRVRNRVRLTDFDDSDEYVQHVLEEVLWQVESADFGSSAEIDESVIKKRLESLGYLNE